MSEYPILRILHYNIQKSYEQVIVPLFSEENIADFDIIALQEPWKNTYQNTTFHL